MAKLSDYTTDELRRLTTLTGATAKVGEYVLQHGVVELRTDTRLVCDDGSETTVLNSCGGLERRVKSFCDPTELDPPQADMLAELRRRERPMPNNVEHGGRRVRSVNSGKIFTLLTEDSARRQQKGWEADGFRTQYVWAVDGNGRITGNPSDQWELLD